MKRLVKALQVKAEFTSEHWDIKKERNKQKTITHFF